ncbi:MAG: ABC transporter substrate-binding protein, partial [Acidimicrobiia bacterium]|nr:ABC transporter substrate-binding protein [Acidimicrobiia bacterium]
MHRRGLRAFLTLAVAAGLVVGVTAPAVARVHAKTPPSTDGFDGKTIKLGVITPLTGTVSLIGTPLTAGNQLWWDYVNGELGGVAGKYKVELVEEDSQYQPATAIQAYDKIKGDVVDFQQILGTQVTKALLPKMQVDKSAGAPATLDAAWVKNANLFPIGAPYQVETINGLDYYTKNGGKGKKVCALAQDDEFGQAGLDGLAYAKKVLKLKTGPTERFKTGEDLTAQIQSLSDAKCDAVLTVATAVDATAIVTKAIALNFSPQMIALAPFWLQVFSQSPNLQQFLVDHLWVSAEQAAAWGDSTVPGMDAFIERQQQYAPSQKPDPYFVFGYLQGQAMYQILQKAVKNGDLSHEGVLKASNQVGTLKFDGLTGDYKYGKSAADRNPPRTTALFKVDPAQPVGLALL